MAVVDPALSVRTWHMHASGTRTWTRRQAWATLGLAEALELLDTMDAAEFEPHGGKAKWEALMRKAATATADNFLANTPTDGISYWDQGAPKLHLLGDYLDRPADPFNAHEPVDSTASGPISRPAAVFLTPTFAM